jgi:hypothetical protein
VIWKVRRATHEWTVKFTRWWVMWRSRLKWGGRRRRWHFGYERNWKKAHWLGGQMNWFFVQWQAVGFVFGCLLLTTFARSLSHLLCGQTRHSESQYSRLQTIVSERVSADTSHSVAATTHQASFNCEVPHHWTVTGFSYQCSAFSLNLSFLIWLLFWNFRNLGLNLN